MSSETVLEMIKKFLDGRGFELVAEDVSHGDEYFAAESFAVRDSSGAAHFVSVSQM